MTTPELTARDKIEKVLLDAGCRIVALDGSQRGPEVVIQPSNDTTMRQVLHVIHEADAVLWFDHHTTLLDKLITEGLATPEMWKEVSGMDVS